MTDDIKRIDIKEFREAGYLQELNRQFLHPLGMAIEVSRNEDGTESLGGIWDYRDDPEGIVFDSSEDLFAKADHVIIEQAKKAQTRKQSLGYVIQPVDSKDECE